MIGYKLFKIKNDRLYPLYVLADKETPMNKWLVAENGPMEDGKVKSKLGSLAYRPGWHLSDIPLATHIGVKQSDGTLAQAKDTVWCECEYTTDINYQDCANKNGTNKKGIIIPKNAYLKYIPVNGYYRYKTNPNMTGEWIISGAIKVNRILTNEQVAEICRANGIKPQRIAA